MALWHNKTESERLAILTGWEDIKKKKKLESNVMSGNVSFVQQTNLKSWTDAQNYFGNYYFVA